MSKKVYWYFAKHGDLIGEYETLRGEREWNMTDTLFPYFKEMWLGKGDKPALFVGHWRYFRSAYRDGSFFLTIPSELFAKLWAPVRWSLRLSVQSLVFFYLLLHRPERFVIMGRYFNFLFPYIYALIFRKRMIVVLIGEMAAELSPLRFLMRRILKSSRTELVLTRGRFPAAELEKQGILPPRMKEIYPNYPPEFFEEHELPEEYGDRTELLFIGRFSREKGIFDLLDIFGSLRAEFPDIRLNYMGSGVDEKSLRSEISERGFDDSVRILGFRHPRLLYTYLKRSALLLIPSYSDSFCKVAVEGVISGVPVVAYAQGGIPYNIDDGRTGFLVPVGDKAAFTESVARLLNAPSLREMMHSEAMRRRERFLNPSASILSVIESLER